MRKGLIGSAVIASALVLSTSLSLDARTNTINDDPPKGQVREMEGEAKDTAKYWLGVRLKNVEGDLAEFLGGEHGVLIEEVQDGSPAAKAGVKKGDIVLKVDGTELNGVEELQKIVKEAKSDQALSLAILRKKEEVEIKVTPELRPANRVLGFDLRKALIGDDPAGLQFHLDPKNMKILRLGEPAGGILANPGLGFEGDLKLHILNQKDGKSLEMKIERQGDKAGVITITKDGETKIYDESQIDELPEEVKATVKSMLKTGKAVSRFKEDFDRSRVWENEALSQIIERAKAFLADDIDARASVEASQTGPKHTKSEKSEVEELRSMIKQLSKEIEELKAAAKSEK